MNAANEGFRNIHKIRVLWTDTDPAGITFYGNYFKWMDEACYYLFKAAGIRWEDWNKNYGALGIPLISAHGDFKSPSRFGDELAVESRVSEWGRSSFTVSHHFINSGVPAAQGWEKRVWCTGDPGNPDSFASAPIPDDVRSALGG
jgi:4-hydroxybenzoyl-CoA thioesterase